MADTQRKYIGARYVPLIMGEWNSSATYEPLSVVLHEGNSYTSRTFVPAGTPIDNDVYWALSGNYQASANGYAKSYDTVAEMQADTTLSAGMICHTLGFHAVGDGGAAWYKVEAMGTANDMDILALVNGVAVLQVTESYVTPEMFGAYGDGVHDDTDFIQYALNNYKNIYADKIYNVTVIYIDNRTNFDFNEITGNLVIKGYRNNITGKKLEGVSPLTLGYETDTCSSNIIQIGYIYASNLTTGSCILLDGSTASVMNNLFVNCQTNRGEYGFHMIADNNGFCNQNVLLMCVSTNANKFGMFLENRSNNASAGEKMNGGRYYNYDPETSIGAIKMVGKCEDHKFYGLRLREFNANDVCFEYDENVNNIEFDNSFVYSQLNFIGISSQFNKNKPKNKCNGLLSDTGSLIFIGECIIGWDYDKPVIYPKAIPDVLLNISNSDDITLSYISSNQNVSYNILRNSASSTSGTQITIELPNCYGFDRIDKIKVFAYTDEIPPKIKTSNGTIYTIKNTAVSAQTMYTLTFVNASTTLVTEDKTSFIYGTV